MAVVEDRPDEAGVERQGRDAYAGLPARRVTIEPWDVQVGPLSHLAAERARLGDLTFEHFAVRQQEATLGAQVEGLDLCRPLEDAVVAELRTALHTGSRGSRVDSVLEHELAASEAANLKPFEIHGAW